MIDFHTHVLPCVDDGSQSMEESLAMLSAMREQGVTTVIATPHFYANDDSIDSFLARRDGAYASLASACENAPRIILGGGQVLRGYQPPARSQKAAYQRYATAAFGNVNEQMVGICCKRGFGYRRTRQDHPGSCARREISVRTKKRNGDASFGERRAVSGKFLLCDRASELA